MMPRDQEKILKVMAAILENVQKIWFSWATQVSIFFSMAQHICLLTKNHSGHLPSFYGNKTHFGESAHGLSPSG